MTLFDTSKRFLKSYLLAGVSAVALVNGTEAAMQHSFSPMLQGQLTVTASWYLAAAYLLGTAVVTPLVRNRLAQGKFRLKPADVNSLSAGIMSGATLMCGLQSLTLGMQEWVAPAFLATAALSLPVAALSTYGRPSWTFRNPFSRPARPAQKKLGLVDLWLMREAMRIS